MGTQEKDPKEINVKGVVDADGKKVVVIVAGDPVLADGKPARVSSIENGIATLNGSTKVPVKELQPLFFENNEGKKVWTKFTYDEVSQAVKNTDNFSVNIPKEQVISLMLGNKSNLLPFKKQIEEKMVEVQGKIELRRGKEGKPYVSHQVKMKELNLDRPIYGRNFSEPEKKLLNESGELGLVHGFKTGDNLFGLWVSVDKELNSVVTKRELDIKIDKVFGVELNMDQKCALKNGYGIVIELKNKSEIYVQASAKTASADGLKVFSKEKALEFGLLEEKKNLNKEKKEKTSKGMKM